MWLAKRDVLCDRPKKPDRISWIRKVGAGGTASPKCQCKNDKGSVVMLEEKSLFRFYDKGHWLNSNNRWKPEADEFAVAFRLEDLSGKLTTTLEIPPGTRAWALIDGEAYEWKEGPQAIESFVSRLNSVFDRKSGDVLITRKAALAVPFEFSGIYSSDRSELGAALSLMIRVGDLAAFRNHFMRCSGPVKVDHLQQLLGPAVRQAVMNFCITRSVDQLKVTDKLFVELAEFTKNRLRWHSIEYGLEIDVLEALTIDHKKSPLELQLDTDAEELLARTRRLDHLEKILRADTREAAITLGARDEIEALDQKYTIARISREQEVLKGHWVAEDEATRWKHLRELATIQYSTECEVAKARAMGEHQLEEARCKAQLEMFLAEASLRQTVFMYDGEEKAAERRRQTNRLNAAAVRLEQLEEERHKFELAQIRIKREALEREAQRIQDFEDSRHQVRILEMFANIPIPPISDSPNPQLKREETSADIDQPGDAQGPGVSAPDTAGEVSTVSQGHLVGRHYKIQEGEVGHSYESIIGPYLAGSTSLEIDDPYIRKGFQLRNFREFCDLVVLSNTVKKITLKTTYEDGDSEALIRQGLERIRDSLEKHGVALEFKVEPSDTFHFREIRIDNGWIILIDRSLDIFKPPPPGDGSKKRPLDQKYRQCRVTSVVIVHREGIGRPSRLGTNSNNSDIPLTLHVMHPRPLVIGRQTTLSFWVRNDSEAVLENVTVTLKGDERLTVTPNACDHVVRPGEMAECHVVLQSNGPAGEIALKVYVEAEARNGGCVLAVATTPLKLLIGKEGTRGKWEFKNTTVVNTMNPGSNDVTFEEGVRIGTIIAGADDGRVIPEVGAKPTTENSTKIPLKRREPRGLGSRIDLGKFAADWPHKQGEDFLSLAFVDDHGKPRQSSVRDIGDKYVLRVRAATPAYLWLFGQSSNGTFQHLFPTKQASALGGRIRAGMDSKYPGDLSGTEPHRIDGVTTDVLGFNDPGTERAVAVCTNQPLDIPGEWKRIEEIPPEKVRRLLTQAYNQAGSVLAMVDIQVVPG